MKLIHKARRSGKTTEMVRRWRKHPNSILIVVDRLERERLRLQYKLSPDEVTRVVTFGEMRARNSRMLGLSRPEGIKIYLDNADMFLHQEIGRLVGFHTLTISTSKETKDERPKCEVRSEQSETTRSTG